jgi:hypothetical protein
MMQSRHLAHTVVLTFTLSLVFFQNPLSAESEQNYLVPVNEEREAGEPFASYRKTIEQKLFLTRGDMGRVVHLPGTIGVETVVSVYQKEPPERDAYWVTVTQPSDSLWNPEGKNGESTSASAKVLRLDAPLPKSTALAIQKVWRAMLLGVREPPESKGVLVDSSTEIFSAAGEDGRLLRGQVEGLPRGNVAALSDLANLLATYCDSPASQRVHRAHTIEKKATILLKRLASSKPGKR